MRLYLIFVAYFVLANGLFANDLKLVIGTHVKNGSKGIYFYNFNEKTGDFGQQLKDLDIYGSSVIGADAVNDYVFTCGAGSEGDQLSSINLQNYKVKQFGSEEDKPCYISVSPDKKYVFVANIIGSSVKSYGLNESTGELKFLSKVVIPPKGKAFKPHAVVPSPDGKFLYVPDIAGTRINKVSISADGKLRYSKDINSKNFKGPRHFCFDFEGKTAYLVNQTGEAVTVFRYSPSDGELEEIGHEQSLPDDKLTINNHISEIKIHPTGRFVYVANRGHDSLTLYHRDHKTGLLKFIECTSSQGNAPWSFDISPNGKFILCSNNKTGNIAAFSIDQKSGKLSFTGKEIKIDKPISSIKLF